MEPGFKTTQWTLVLQAADVDSPERDKALAELVEANWYPLYAFLRRSGKPAHEAEDLIQAFFARLIGNNLLDNLQGAQRGRFRNFLLVALKRFAANQWQKDQTQRRGGGQQHVSIDFQFADQRYQNEPFHELTPDRAFDRSWALELIERALAEVRHSWQQAGKLDQFEKLKVFLVATEDAPRYQELASELGGTAGALRVAVHRLRAEFRQAICEAVANTLDRGDWLEDEINYLFSALST